MKKVMVIILSMVMLFVLSACSSGSEYDPTDDYTEIVWPSSALVGRLPVPESTLGEINSESDNYFNVDIAATDEQFNSYVSACQEVGFTVDYHKSSTSFWAYDAEGYYVSVSYYGNWQEMSISIRTPEDEEDSQGETTTITARPTTTTKAPDKGLGKDFKAAMDSYEKFMDDYVAFMKKYQANPSDFSLLADYAKFVSDYSKMMTEFEKWEDEDLNDAELDYYFDVQARVNKKMLEVAG